MRSLWFLLAGLVFVQIPMAHPRGDGSQISHCAPPESKALQSHQAGSGGQGAGGDKESPPSGPVVLRLQLEASKPFYDECEPVVVRAWLINESDLVYRIPRCRLFRSAAPTTRARGRGREDSQGWFWLSGPGGKPIVPAYLQPRKRLSKHDPVWVERSQAGFGGNGRGGVFTRPIRYWCLSAGGRLLVGERRFGRRTRELTTAKGRKQTQLCILQPGKYMVKAVIRSCWFLLGEGADLANRKLAPAKMELRNQLTVKIIPSRRDLEHRWFAFTKLRLGTSLAMVVKRVGPSWSDQLYLPDIEKMGTVEVRVMRWRLDGLASPPSPSSWGRLRHPQVTAWFSADGTRLLRLVGELYATREF